MIYFTKFNKYTGRIRSTGCSPDPVEFQIINEIDDVVEGSCNLETDYVNLTTRTIEPRPVITSEPNKTTILADGNDLFLLIGLPVPCTVTVDADVYEITDGEFGFTTILPGEYIVKVESFPYMPRTWEVTAV